MGSHCCAAVTLEALVECDAIHSKWQLMLLNNTHLQCGSALIRIVLLKMLHTPFFVVVCYPALGSLLIHWLP